MIWIVSIVALVVLILWLIARVITKPGAPV